MSWYAQIGIDDIVQQVVFASNEFDEPKMAKHYGGKWVQTSETGEFRNIFAYSGCTYDKTLDAFVEPKLYDSWIFDIDSMTWQAPAPYPSDGKNYVWDENTQSWVLFKGGN